MSQQPRDTADHVSLGLLLNLPSDTRRKIIYELAASLGLRLEPGSPLCKGDLRIGSGCGVCERCRNQAVCIVREVLADNAILAGRAALLQGALPQPPAPGREGGDHSEKFKLACFEEARRIAWFAK